MREKWIDVVRAFAIICVVLCHATEAVYWQIPGGVLSLSARSEIFYFLCFTIGRLGVPCFLMMTGYLLLSRNYDEEGIKTFWKNRWIHLLVCTWVWFAIYDLFLVLFAHNSISILDFCENILFFRKVNMSHVWYLPVILGLYLLLPFVASVLTEYDLKIFCFPLIVYTFFAFGVPLLIVISKISGRNISNQFSLGFSGSSYGLYIIYGFFIKKGMLKKVKTEIIMCISFFSFISCVLLQMWSYHRGFTYDIWYDNILLLFTTVGLFELASRLKIVHQYKTIKMIAVYSFPIYLIHNIILAIIRECITNIAMLKPFQVLCLWTISFFVSLITGVLISKIPRIGKFILFMK